MHTVEWVLEQLSLIQKHMWNISLDNSALSSLKTKISELSAQIAVHHALENTVTQVRESAALTNPQSRVGKFLDVLYGGLDCPSSADGSRWERLRSLDYQSFLLIAVSYTPLDITKMPRIEFDYLITNAPKYTISLPPRWIFRKDFQMAVANKAELAGIAQFKRGYHALEFDTATLDVEEPCKRPCTEQGSHEGHPPIDRPQDTHQQVEEPLQAIRAPSPDHPANPRRLIEGEIEQGQSAASLSPSETQIEYRYSEAPITLVHLLGEPLASYLQSSRQWKRERGLGGSTTDCVNLLSPKHQNQDMSVNILVGVEEGTQLVEKLQLKSR